MRLPHADLRHQLQYIIIETIAVFGFFLTRILQFHYLFCALLLYHDISAGFQTQLHREGRNTADQPRLCPPGKTYAVISHACNDVFFTLGLSCAFLARSTVSFAYKAFFALPILIVSFWFSTPSQGIGQHRTILDLRLKTCTLVSFPSYIIKNARQYRTYWRAFF